MPALGTSGQSIGLVYWLNAIGRKVALPALEIEITETEWRTTATIVFAADLAVWDATQFNISTDEIRIERVQYIAEQATLRNELVFIGSLDSPKTTPLESDELRFTFTEAIDLEMQLPITVDIQGDLPVADVVDLIVGETSYNSSTVYTPPQNYPTLPNNTVTITKSTNPLTPMGNTTFAEIVAWANFKAAKYGDDDLDIETWLYYDDPDDNSPSNPYYSVGPWDQTYINNYPNNLTVQYERYLIHPDGTLERTTAINPGGGGAIFLPEVLNRSAYIRPAGYASRDIRKESCLTVGSQLRTLATEFGLRRVWVRGGPLVGGEIVMTDDPRPTLPTIIIDAGDIKGSPETTYGMGSVTHVCLTGADDAHAVAGNVLPGKRTKVVRERVEVGPEAIADVAQAYLDELSQPSASHAVQIADKKELRTVGGSTWAKLPEVFQKVRMLISMAPPTSTSSTGYYGAAIDEQAAVISKRVLSWDRDGNETITISVGKAAPTVQEMLSRIV